MKILRVLFKNQNAQPRTRHIKWRMTIASMLTTINAHTYIETRIQSWVVRWTACGFLGIQWRGRQRQRGEIECVYFFQPPLLCDERLCRRTMNVWNVHRTHTLEENSREWMNSHNKLLKFGEIHHEFQQPADRWRIIFLFHHNIRECFFHWSFMKSFENNRILKMNRKWITRT